jgi:phosphopantothenoylcysteine synthetase/decarboxylase
MSLFSGKNILVTSGGTREYLDDVRVVTNISTGALGAIIAEELYHHGARVYYVHGISARMPVLDEGFSDGVFYSYSIKTCEDLHFNMKALISVGKMDAVIHSAAVSDFTFKRDGATKISSDSAEDLVEYIRRTITKTPKIIQEIKEWCPETVLVGFKFTVGKTYEELIDIALESARKSKCDAVFANDKTSMSMSKKHVGVLLNMLTGIRKDVVGKHAIAASIVSFLSEAFERGIA